MLFPNSCPLGSQNINPERTLSPWLQSLLFLLPQPCNQNIPILERQLPCITWAAQILRLQRFYPHSNVQDIGCIHRTSEGPGILRYNLKPDLTLVCDF